jgi:predicted GIY-YIG superfamily endonuclease
MYYTYILKSIKTNGAIYVGYTADLKSRLSQHNSPDSKFYSRRHSPWVVESYIGFTDKREAENFETYLKSNSGKAFLRKRLISNQFKEALAKFNNGREKKVSETQ